jgi:hypothetical protein
MAVYQLSKIQIRRGQAGQGTGIPQLASGEMAWAIDTQELWIGNGSVAEGAPAVGNTKILTNNDLSVNGSLLGLLQHIYKVTDSSVTTGINTNTPVSRTLQSKLDEVINVLDFGAVADGQLIDPLDINSGYTGTDNTAALQRAINQCFLNTSLKASGNNGATERITLKIPAGVYVISDTLYLPSYANIIGDGVDKTIIYYTSTVTVGGTITTLTPTLQFPAASSKYVGAYITGTGIPANTRISSVTAGVSFTLSNNATQTGTFSFTVVLARPAIKTVNDSSAIGSTPSTITVNPSTTSGLNQPRNITFRGMTIAVASGKNTALHLDSLKDSYFKDIKLKGNWQNSLYSLSRGIYFSGISHAITCSNIHFADCTIQDFSYAITAYQDITNLEVTSFDISNCYQGIVFGFNVETGFVSSGASGSDQSVGPCLSLMQNLVFTNIKRHAIISYLGTNNNFNDIRLTNVGCNGGGNLGGPATYPQIYFAQANNFAEKVISDRANDFATQNTNLVYVPEVAGQTKYTVPYTYKTTLNQNISYNLAFRLPVSTNAISSPVGGIQYTIDYFYNSTQYLFVRKGTIHISADIDNALIQLSDEYDFAGADPNFTYAPLLDFEAKFFDQAGALYIGSAGQVPSSIAVRYLNTLSNDNGVLSYSYQSIS